MVYHLQRKWNQSLESYHKALEWKLKTGNEFKFGSTYTQIGMVYHEQRKWKLSLENYQNALELDIKKLGRNMNWEVLSTK